MTMPTIRRQWTGQWRAVHGVGPHTISVPRLKRADDIDPDTFDNGISDEIFDGFTGVVESIDTENNTVKVSVSALFGKQTTVELELDQVELAE